MAPIRVESDYLITISPQTTWNTAVTATSIGLPSADLIITMEADKHIIPRDRGIRYAHEDDSFQDTSATFPTAKLSFPVTSNILKNVLGGLLQKTPAWAASPANVYEMFPSASSAMPLMGATAAASLSSEGYFFTLHKRSPTANLSEQITNAVPRSMSLSLHPTDNFGVLWCEMEFVGTTYTATANLDSTGVTQEALTRTLIYPWGDLYIVTYGGTSLFSDFVSFKLDMTWNAQLANGNPRGYMIFPKFEASATVVAGQNAALAAAKGYLRSSAVSTGRALVLTWGDGTVSEAGEMNITCFGRVDSFDDNDRTEGEVMTMGLACEQGGATEYPVGIKFFAA